MRVPGGDVVVTYWPGNAVPEFSRGPELVVAPALAGPPPGEGFPAHLIAPDPVEGPLLHIRVVGIANEKMGRVFPEPGGFGNQRICLVELARHPPPVGEFPGVLIPGRVVFEVFDIAPALQYQGLQALFAQFLGSPSPRDPRPDHDGVKMVFRHSLILVNIWHIGAQEETPLPNSLIAKFAN